MEVRVLSAAPIHFDLSTKNQALTRRAATRILGDSWVTRAEAIALACLALGGCEGERYIETPPALCLEACVDGRISDLSSVDHETLSGDAIRAIHESCAATAEPCCKAYGNKRYVRLTCPETTR